MGLDLALGDSIIHGSDSSTVDLEFVTTMSLLSFSWERGERERKGIIRSSGALELSNRDNKMPPGHYHPV